VTYSVGFDGIDVEAANGEWYTRGQQSGAGMVCRGGIEPGDSFYCWPVPKKLTWLNELVKKGAWRDSRAILPPMVPVHGQTLGLVACGDIGRMTAKKAQVFG